MAIKDSDNKWTLSKKDARVSNNRKAGKKKTPKGKPRGRPFKRILPPVETLLDHIKSGLQPYHIAYLYGVSKPAITQAFRDHRKAYRYALYKAHQQRIVSAINSASMVDWKLEKRYAFNYFRSAYNSKQMNAYRVRMSRAIALQQLQRNKDKDDVSD